MKDENNWADRAEQNNFFGCSLPVDLYYGDTLENKENVCTLTYSICCLHYHLGECTKWASCAFFWDCLRVIPHIISNSGFLDWHRIEDGN